MKLTTKLFCSIFLLSFALNAKVLYVDANSSSVSPDGLSWTTAYTTVNTAMGVAVEGDSVFIAEGDYKLSGGQLTKKNGVNVYGGFHSENAIDIDTRDWETYETILRGDSTMRIIFPAASSTVNTYYDGLTLVGGGSSSKNGAGAYLYAGNHLVNCTIKECEGKNGAVNFDGKTATDDFIPSMTNCIVEDNFSVQGSIYFNSIGLMTECTVRNNFVNGNCGGAFLNANCVIENSILENNECTGSGGAIFFRLGGTATGCTMQGNIAQGNGGAVCFNSGGLLQYCTIRDNTATTHGGGVYAYVSDESYTGKVLNCKIFNNVASGQGGGMWLRHTSEVHNTSVYNNQSAQAGGGVYSLGARIINATITNNKCEYDSTEDYYGCGGIVLDGYVDSEVLMASSKVYNTVVWGNEDANNASREQVYCLYDDYENYGKFSNCAIQDLATADVPSDSYSSCVDLSADNADGPMFTNPSLNAGANVEVEEVIEPSTFISPNDIVTKSTAFDAGDDGIHTYRIPAVVTANDGSVLVFCEARKATWSDKSATDLVMKRSTDNGATWSAYTTIAAQTGTQAYMDPAPIVDKTTGRIFIFACRWASSSASYDTNIGYLSYSDDNGQTWSTPTDVTDQVTAEGWSLGGFGPGSGLQIEQGKNAGRLCVATRQYESATGNYRLKTVYSDDNGATWTSGANGSSGGEQQIAQSTDGVLTTNIRASSGVRYKAYSYDGGESWGNAFADATLPGVTGGCHASVLGQDSVMFFAGPAGGETTGNYDNRYNLELYRSYNGGKSWTSSYSLYSLAAGYSCMTVLQDGSIGLVFETADTKGFTKSSGRSNGWMRIDLIVIPAELWNPSTWISE